ncbi:asparagine synthase (glutamine-hydrolyzing), partial [Candidatus Thioglobus sp.]|nr:asparagine synthase (glutamine-hydrolyzing) [Candidatus Thioglobus sp.]
MCGIAGIYSPNISHNKLINIAENMASAIYKRGPDDEGVWIDVNANIALSHRRLSIIDLSDNGRQPMKSHCGKFTMVFNGEIYNHNELRRQLNNLGDKPSWKGNSDSEVLLCGIAKWGLKLALKKSTGMFALALWDREAKKLYLARDRFGEKPIYYGHIGKDFVFGSELKALQAHPSFNSGIDRKALSSFLQYSYVPSPKSIYKDILKLPPANILCVDLPNGNKTLSSYWSLQDYSYNEVSQRVDEKILLSELHKKLNNTVAEQMIADVPVGAFLSGGIDSSLIVALMQKNSTRTIDTFSIGFSEKEYDESFYARQVSKLLGTNHTEMIVTPKELLNVVPKLKKMYDEPFADSSQVPTYLVSKLARNKVTVSLTGDGGDEVFGGYNRYRWANDVWSKMEYLPFWFRRFLSTIISIPSEQRWKKIYSLLEFVIPLKYRMRLPGEKIRKISVSLSALNIEELYTCLTSLWIEAENIVIGVNENKANDFYVKGRSIAEKMMFLDLGIYL